MNAMSLNPHAHARPLADAATVVEFVRDLEGLVAMGPEWRALEDRAAGVFQSHDQTVIWARNYVTAGSDRHLLIALVRVEGLLRLIVPLYVETQLGTRMARITGRPIAQYSDVLASSDADAQRYLPLVVDALRSENVDVLNLDSVREHTPLHRLALDRHAGSGNKRVAPFAELDRFADHTSFVRSRSKGFGKKMRARRRQLEETGEVRLEMIEGGPAARKAMGEAVNLKREWLSHRGAMSSAFLDPLSHGCLLDLAENAPGAMVLMMLLNGTIVAIRLGFSYHGTFFSYLSAYDEKLAPYSPGQLLMDYTLSVLRGRNVGHLDMLPPGSDNKAIWCADAVAVADYVLPLSWRGHLHAILYTGGRRALRGAYYGLPAWLRRGLADRLLARNSAA